MCREVHLVTIRPNAPTHPPAVAVGWSLGFRRSLPPARRPSHHSHHHTHDSAGQCMPNPRRAPKPSSGLIRGPCAPTPAWRRHVPHVYHTSQQHQHRRVSPVLRNPTAPSLPTTWGSERRRGVRGAHTASNITHTLSPRHPARPFTCAPPVTRQDRVPSTRQLAERARCPATLTTTYPRGCCDTVCTYLCV